MTRLIPIALVAVLLSACGSTPSNDSVDPSPRVVRPALDRPATPLTSATLERVALDTASRTRLGFVNLGGLAEATLPVASGRVAAAVLGRRAPAGETAIRVGDRLVDPDGRPAQTAITPEAPSAVQACLGDTLAQTILGSETMGRDAALGVGLTATGLRVCGAPRLLRHERALRAALARRFPDGAFAREEIGERIITAGSVPAGAVSARTLLRLLAAGPTLRALAWR